MKFSIKRTGNNPSLTDQIADQLSDYIHKGTLHKGTVLPSERELATSAKVARNVVRGAFARLESDGLIKNNGRLGRVVKATTAKSAKGPSKGPAKSRR